MRRKTGQRADGPTGRPASKILALFCLFVTTACLVSGCVPSRTEVVPAAAHVRLHAEPWSEACRNFRSDPRWLGGDGAYSVDLGAGRILWLFGDSFVDPSGSGNRRNAALLRNSVAIQTGYDPSKAEVAFFWGRTGTGAPQSFFADEAPNWYWPGDGIAIRRNLVVFLMTIGSANNKLGFETAGWAAVLIDNPDASPNLWNLRRLVAPENLNGIVVGGASVLLWDDFVYAYSTQASTRAVFLARWPADSLASGDLSGMQWWAGEAGGWVACLPGKEPPGQTPVPLFSDGQMEFSVQFMPSLNRWLQIQTRSFIEPWMAARWAPGPTGPWSSMESFFRPPFLGQAGLVMYAGKSHPECTGAPLVLTYAVNTLDPNRLFEDRGIYYPEFLKGFFMVEE